MTMREILFRGKRLDNGKWIENFLICPLFDKSRAYIGTLFAVDDHDTDLAEVDPETVGQYTGLTDKNGKKIFEGDIVITEDGFIFSVEYGKCGGVPNVENYGYIGFYLKAFSAATKVQAKYGLRDDIFYFKDIKVIGNVYDNPELERR